MPSPRLKRFAEILPATLLWTTLFGSVALSYFYPIVVIGFVIVFDVYWMLRIIYYTPFLLHSWWKYRKALSRDWQKDAQALPGYGDIYHLVMLPTWKEPIEIIRVTFENLLASSTPSDRLIICLGGEERDRKHFEENARLIREEYGKRFKGLFVTVHPDPTGKPDEIQGKGSNLHWMAECMVPHIEAMKIAPEHLIVSSFDVDTITDRQYFSCLTCTYLTTPNPTRSSYQPVALYNNNLWDAKAPIRVAMFGTTFWLMGELARPERMQTFSSHAMSWRMLLDVGFWAKNITSEDSHIFLQGFVRYHGDYRVTPMHIAVSMDSTDSVGYVNSLKALYKQMRRWAWGVENFPYMVENFVGDKEMPFRLKAAYLWKQLEGGYTWATAPLLITLLGRLPFWFASENYRSFAVFQNTPFTLQMLMQFSLVGAFLSAGLALTLLPKRPSYISKPYGALIMILQWLLLPVTFVIFGSFPAIDAQTRLLLGGKFRLGFNVTSKIRVKR